jgi:hypothetical protein
MTAQIRQESLRYYANAGPVTDIEKYREFVDWLTDDVRAIFQVVQGILVHDGWLKAYGIEFNDAQRYDFNSLTMETVLDKAVELGGKSLSIPRAPDKRVIGCCREFATLMTALLRAKGTPGADSPLTSTTHPHGKTIGCASIGVQSNLAGYW